MVQNILLSGVGGQGILLAAKIIATAPEYAGFQVAANDIRGMTQRGGSLTAQIRYGDRIFLPLIREGSADVPASLEAVENCGTASGPVRMRGAPEQAYLPGFAPV